MIDEEGNPAQAAEEFATQQSKLFADGFSFSGYERDLVCLNLGDRFIDVSGVSGADSVSDGRGSARVDLDNDGDLDIVLRAVHGRPLFLFRNLVGQEAGWVRLTLQGTISGQDAFGTVVRLGFQGKTLTRVKSGGSGFVSQSDPRLLFGLGEVKQAEWMEVRWPSGLKQRFPGPVAGASLLLIEGEEAAVPIAEQRCELPAPLTFEERAWKLLAGRRGDSLTDVTVTELDGSERRLSQVLADEGPTVVSFWATWCRSCTTEMKHLQELSEQGSAVVGISIDAPSSRQKIPEFLDRLGITYPIYTMNQDQVELLFASRDAGIPISLVVDQNRQVKTIVQGWSPESRRQLESNL
ncbi:MAG: redoxin domain-containing protein [bacterium]|nr:redoxin domain-containing protein [bacterium]